MRFPMCRVLTKNSFACLGNSGRLSALDMVPNMGIIGGMNIREYINSGVSDIATLADRLGVSRHAVHKWVYGQRRPSLEMMIEIADVTGGAVAVESWVKDAPRRTAA